MGRTYLLFLLSLSFFFLGRCLVLDVGVVYMIAVHVVAVHLILA
jgi:hypothetical protein